jgi:hypothetical protein
MNVAFAIGTFRRAGAAAPREGTTRATPPLCLLDRLQLDSAQRAKLAKMRQRLQVKRETFWRRSAAIKAELADAICAQDTRSGTLDPLLARYAREQRQMQRSVTDHLRQVGTMLRPDQRERFHELLRTEMFRGLRSAPGSAGRKP